MVIHTSFLLVCWSCIKAIFRIQSIDRIGAVIILLLIINIFSAQTDSIRIVRDQFPDSIWKPDRLTLAKKFSSYNVEIIRMEGREVVWRPEVPHIIWDSSQCATIYYPDSLKLGDKYAMIIQGSYYRKIGPGDGIYEFSQPIYTIMPVSDYKIKSDMQGARIYAVPKRIWDLKKLSLHIDINKCDSLNPDMLTLLNHEFDSGRNIQKNGLSQELQLFEDNYYLILVKSGIYAVRKTTVLFRDPNRICVINCKLGR